MFDKLEATLYRMEEVMRLLSAPETAGDPKQMQELMKEQAELQPVTQTYQAYKEAKNTMEESMEMTCAFYKKWLANGDIPAEMDREIKMFFS